MTEQIETGEACVGGADVAGSGLRLNPGDHICAFYRQPSERDEILIPFLLDGLKAGDKCTCVVDSCDPQDVLDRLDTQIDVGSYLSDKQLEVLDSDRTYLADGGFLPARMLEFWAMTRPPVDGVGQRTFYRNVGDMSWAHRDRPGVAQLISYEAEFNRLMAGRPHVTMCLYDLRRCSGELLFDVLRTHPKALLGGMVIENPYYLDPAELLRAPSH